MGRSTPTAAQEVLLGIGPLQKSICLQVVKAYLRIKGVHLVKFIEDGGPGEHLIGELIVMRSDITS